MSEELLSCLPPEDMWHSGEVVVASVSAASAPVAARRADWSPPPLLQPIPQESDALGGQLCSVCLRASRAVDLAVLCPHVNISATPSLQEAVSAQLSLCPIGGMLKHVQLSPFRSRADTLSLSSTSSYCSLSPEPLSSRSSSYSSLSESSPAATTIKVYARCLRADIEYKTLSITFQTTCREVVTSLLNKYRMRHRDPNLFYLTMEVTVRKAGVRTVLVLDEDSRPAALQCCHPRGDSRFALQTRRGGLVKIYDSILMPASQYKSLLISDRTTVDELIHILLRCYNSQERVEQFSLYEVCPSQEYQRKLHPDDCPLQVQQCWPAPQLFQFLVKRNAGFRPRRKGPWTPELPSIPSCPRQPDDTSPPPSPRPTSSACTDYDNYFYI
ncbi:uncharacterized protein LOC134541810 [Bacillus rossius redtenbacheri]|uniref:uncharacterized protein LOC134541810 n=1 Tax=Bacillus rossius redtenbacheri TaxID=93214 RepID=UPI002FDE89A3